MTQQKPMSWRQVRDGIDALPAELLDGTANVFPPLLCPETVRVPITALTIQPDGEPLLLTGKMPAPEGA